MIARYRFLRLFLRNLICFRGNKRDELDAAFDQEVACIFGEGDAGIVGEDLVDDLLDGRCAVALVNNFRILIDAQVPLGSDKSSLPPNSRSDMVVVSCSECDWDSLSPVALELYIQRR